jgi:hypothetical protein
MSLFLVLVVALCTSTHAFQSSVRSSTHTSRQSLRMDTAEKNFFQEDSTKRMMNMIEADTRVPKVSLADQLRLMQSTDIAMADNYWEGTMPRTKKIRSAAAKTKDVASRIKVDENYYDLMNTGFDRRFSDEKRGESPLLAAAKLTSFQLELAKSKSEQLADLSKQRLEERTGVMKVVPPGLHKFIDYANSMYKKPAQSEVVKNLSLGGFFSFVIFSNTGARSAFMYFVIGNLAIMSSLLTRNMPKVTAAPGMDKKKVVSWSSNAFKTALAMTLSCTIATALSTVTLLSLLPVPLAVKLKSAMIASMLTTSFVTSYYEVFESKGKGGSRWAKAQEGTLPADVEAKLAKEVYGSGNKADDLYDYEYNPQIDDYPAQPKYVDELKPVEAGGSGELDEGESLEHFEKWRQWRRESRRPPVEDAPPETPWVGSKEGMYVTKVPTWLSTAYKANVLKANNWRDKPARFVKDNTEFELITGPFGFRDKFPEWLKMFGNDVWEERTSQSRKLARSFGTYRKTMWVIDKKVKLLPCDGADKEVDFKK